MEDPKGVTTLPSRNTSWIKATVNLVKSAVGLGTVLLVGKLQIMGLGFGLMTLVAAAAISSLSLHFLSRMAYNLDVGDYMKMSRLAFGKWGELTAIICLLLVLLGSLTAYAFFIGTYVRSGLLFFAPGVKGGVLGDYRFYSTILVLVPVLGLSCLRDLSKLALTSILGMLLMLFLTGLVIYKSATGDISKEAAEALAKGVALNPQFLALHKPISELAAFQPLSLAALGCFGDIIFAYMNHFTIVALMPVLKQPTPARRLSLNIVATITATVIYCTVAFFGYRYYGNAMVEDVLSVPLMNGVFATAKLLVAFVLICSYPLLADPTRGALDSLIGFFASGPAFKAAVQIRHYAETIAVVSVPLIIAVLAGDKSFQVLSITSAFFGGVLVFVLPPAMFLRLRRKYITSPTERILAYVLVVLGVAISIAGPIEPIGKIAGVVSAPKHVFKLIP
jgi:amino acid permease